ncbi:MAG TPA: HlyD family efflux transporter periplasmic adaptor subunit [Pirellulaceae bacterium]|nr:HlyD family efflux transporter periplasmic adaptor subunit [Pirellulaceae bacterium]
MNIGSPPPLDDFAPAEAWQEIESALEELAQLSRRDLPPGEFHSRLMERMTGVLAAVGGVVWSFGSEGRPAIECQLHLDQSLAGNAAELGRHQRLAESVAAAGEARLVPPAFRDAQHANASPWLAILCPISPDGEARYVVEVFQRPDGRSAVEEGYLRLVRTACDIAEQFHRGRLLRELKANQGELASLVEYSALIHQRLDLRLTAAAIANEARRVLSCDRVSVLACAGRHPKVAAISGVETFDRRSGIVRALEAVARPVVAVGEPLCYPADADELPEPVAEQVQTLVDQSHARGLLVIPLLNGPADAARTIGLLAIEQFGQEIDSGLRKRAAALVETSAAALSQAIEYERIPLRGPLTWLAAVLGLGPGRRWSPALTAIAVLAAAVIALAVIPVELTVEARGRLMPVRRQHVFAPSDAVVVELTQQGGAEVQLGQTLAKLHSPALDIAQSELVGKQRTVQEELLAAETEFLRGETEGKSPASRTQLAGRVQQLKEELRGLDAQLQIVRQQLKELEITSPLAGVVITWDAQRQLAGRPVKRGDSLLTVADLSGPWELLLDVPDDRAGPILETSGKPEEMQVTFQLGTDPGVVREAKVKEVSPATELSPENAPSVLVTAALPQTEKLTLRPGASVVARVHCGRRSLGYVWLHEFWEAVRLRLFL